MKIVYITAGAAGRYCGNCLRDNDLARGLRELGEDVLLVPTYTPIRTDLEDQSEDRLFYNGLRVYLEEKWAFFRKPRPLLDKLLGRPWLIRSLSRFAGKTRAEDLGALTVSMLEGEKGHQAKELDELVDWLAKDVKPDLVQLSNVLLVGLARRLRERLGVPVICGLQAEDSFLDHLGDPWRGRAIELIEERATECDGLLATSRAYAETCARVLGLPRERIEVVPAGVPLEGHELIDYRQGPALTLGYLARLAPEKGLQHLVRAFIELAREPELPGLRLRVAGYLAPERKAWLEGLKSELDQAGLAERASFHPDVDRSGKLAHYHSIDLSCVPTDYPDPKGLFVLEALASGVPVVAPTHGAFPELLEATGGGVGVAPGEPEALTGALRRLLLDVEERRRLGEAGSAAVRERFSHRNMAASTLAHYVRWCREGEEPRVHEDQRGDHRE